MGYSQKEATKWLILKIMQVNKFKSTIRCGQTATSGGTYAEQHLYELCSLSKNIYRSIWNYSCFTQVYPALSWTLRMLINNNKM